MFQSLSLSLGVDCIAGTFLCGGVGVCECVQCMYRMCMYRMFAKRSVIKKRGKTSLFFGCLRYCDFNFLHQMLLFCQNH